MPKKRNEELIAITENVAVDFVELDLTGAGDGREGQRRSPRISDVPEKDVGIHRRGGEIVGVGVRPVQVGYHSRVGFELSVLLQLGVVLPSIQIDLNRAWKTGVGWHSKHCTVRQISGSFETSNHSLSNELGSEWVSGVKERANGRASDPVLTPGF